ncbi:MAG: bifunctional nuclease family protein [Collinsella sp.]|nr:bifunctional nuclease family protein [Collinsella sp.]
MIRVDIETIIMAAGPVPSVVVLRERGDGDGSVGTLRALSIQTGSFEAAAIGRGIDRVDEPRPITHDLMVSILSQLECKLERVEINRVEAPVFFASLIIANKEGEQVVIDARPSDALSLAVRVNAPIFVEDDVMNRAGSVSLQANQDTEEEIERFDQFVQTLSPDDF